MEDYHINPADFKVILESVPDCCLILKPDTPRFTIVAVTDAYARATNIAREHVLGKGIFEVFPDNPNDPRADGVKNLTASLNRVITKKASDRMPIQKYDIPLPTTEGSRFEVRYWDPSNSPVLNNNNEVMYIIHHVADVTQYENLLQTYAVDNSDTKDFSGQISQIDRLSKLIVARELKMIELKEQIKLLEERVRNRG